MARSSCRSGTPCFSLSAGQQGEQDRYGYAKESIGEDSEWAICGMGQPVQSE